MRSLLLAVRLRWLLEAVCEQNSMIGGWWECGSGMISGIDFVEPINVITKSRGGLTTVIGIHAQTMV